MGPWIVLLLLTADARAEATPGAAPEAPKAAQSITEEALKLRDPFKAPKVTKSEGPRDDLEKFPIDALRVIGVISGPQVPRAMIVTPEGKTFYIRESQRLGNRGGIVTRIQHDGIHVTEKIVNVLGQEEAVETDIALPAVTRPGAAGGPATPMDGATIGTIGRARDSTSNPGPASTPKK